MKKATLVAAALLAGVTMTANPLQAHAACTVQTGRAKAIPTEKIVTVNTATLREYLEECQWGNVKVFTIPCQPEDLENILGKPCRPGKPENQPEAPETEKPDSKPETPETEKPELPETNIPETKPENPDTNQPETEQPGEDDTNQSVHAYVLRIVELVNEERAKAGLKPLTLDENVTAAAQVRAIESEKSFSHTRPNGTSFATALKEAGVSYRGAGENIAWGQKTPERVMEGWMSSDGHRANILNAKYTTIGVGYYQNAAGVNYWSQLFTY